MSDYKLTVDVGVIIIQVLSYTISVFGFTFIHRFEKFSWVWIFVFLSILLAQTVPRLNSSSSSVSMAQDGIAGPFLSFIAINFSSASGWSPIVADYYCNYSSNTPTWKVFLLTVFGIGIPTIFTTVIRSCVGELAFNSSDSIYSEAFSKHGPGGLLQTVYHPIGFSKFSMVILMFSVLGNNIVSCYSSGLSIQLLVITSMPFQGFCGRCSWQLSPRFSPWPAKTAWLPLFRILLAFWDTGLCALR